MMVAAAVLLFLAVALVTDGRPESRYLAVLFVIVASVLLIIELTPIHGEDSGSGPGYRVSGAAALAPPLVTIPTTTTSSTTTTTTTRPPARTTVPNRTDLGVFKITCYGPPHFPAGQTTASGAPVGPGSFAVDPAVIPLGTRLDVEGYGVGVANDRGSAVRGRHVDVWRSDPYNDCAVRSARVRVLS